MTGGDGQEDLVLAGTPWPLRRLPLKRDDRLRAWDTADLQLLEAACDDAELAAAGPVLVVNDAFGALAVPLHGRVAASWGDSHLAELALRYNLVANGCAADAVPFVPATETPRAPVGLVLLKLPRSLVLLRDQLLRLRTVLAPDAHVLVGGMIKHTPMSVWRLLEEIIGPARTSQGRRKARYGHARLALREGLPAAEPDVAFDLPDTDLSLVSGPNVFSRERPDAGSRLLLAHLPQRDDACRAVDLGCGNGMLAVALALRCPAARITGVDISHQAVASARQNAVQVPDGPTRLEFRVDDAAAGLADESCDLVVCNPPFHQGHATGDLQAWEMFKAARRILRPGGELLVVGNRHLGYHVKLRRLFDAVDLLGSDRRFVVLRAVRSTSRT
ncbi:methyltransferase [bacterium]|nr:methyltransferase [bacterium]